ncbi:GGDEF domain-containing protein [Spirochaeta dissipatitropha]
MHEDSLRQYTTLEDSGLLSQLHEYQAKSHDYEELISQSLELFTKTSEEDLVSYLSSCLVQRFIPSYLVVFIRRDESSSNQKDPISSICFQNLRPARCPVSLASLENFREIFDTAVSALTIEQLSQISADCAAELSPLNPEIILPLKGLIGLYGIVVLGRKVLDDDYTAKEKTYIEMLFEFASIGLQNVIHYTSSVTDFKTRLYNHSYFIRRMTEEIHRVDRYHHGFALMAIDIDFFKSLNDQYGHLAGDRALFQLSRIIEDSVREEDIVSRYGGEEFLVLLTECSKGSALSVAERMRETIARTPITYQDLELSLSVSIGITHCAYPPDDDPKHLINEADQALYRAKKNGRNRCELYSNGLLLLASRYSKKNQFT